MSVRVMFFLILYSLLPACLSGSLAILVQGFLVSLHVQSPPYLTLSMAVQGEAAWGSELVQWYAI